MGLNSSSLYKYELIVYNKQMRIERKLIYVETLSLCKYFLKNLFSLCIFKHTLFLLFFFHLYLQVPKFVKPPLLTLNSTQFLIDWSNVFSIADGDLVEFSLLLDNKTGYSGNETKFHKDIQFDNCAFVKFNLPNSTQIEGYFILVNIQIEAKTKSGKTQSPILTIPMNCIINISFYSMLYM
jgi:hypothetical protein